MNETQPMPTWFRRTLIVVATLLMCSCRAAGAECPSCPLGAPCQSCESCDSGSCPIGGSCAVEGCPCCEPGRYAGPGDEYLCDGGDRQFSVGVERDGKMVGLETEDTVATYTGCEGKTIVAPSTRTCIYAPRFASVRRVVHPMGALQRDFVGQTGDVFSLAGADSKQRAGARQQNTGLQGQVLPLPAGLYRGRQQAGGTEQLFAAADALSPVGPYATLQLMQSGVIEMGEAALVARHSLAAVTWTGDQELKIAISGQAASAIFSQKHPGLLYQVDEGCPRLRLVKVASTDTAHPGDEVEFTLRYDNVGDAPLSELVLVDNLTTRLEYVADSAKSSRDAAFSTTRNDAGSLILRWELADRLPAGEGGVITFRCRVR